MNLPIMESDTVDVRQVSFFLNQNFLVSFYDGDFSLFHSVAKRLQDSGSRLRSRNVDFLLYSLIDIVIDQGFPVLESFGLQMEARNNIGNLLTEKFTDKITPLHYCISQFKVMLHYIRIFIWPFGICIEYDWKLVGGGHDESYDGWSQAGYVDYTMSASSSYTFSVKARDEAGNETEVSYRDGLLLTSNIVRDCISPSVIGSAGTVRTVKSCPGVEVAPKVST